MFISHKHKVIFIHNAKTGGISITNSFRKRFKDVEVFWHVHLKPVDDLRMFALETKNKVTKEQWESYFKFSFIRNPYDRIVSLFFNIKQSENKASLKNEIINVIGGDFTFDSFLKLCLRDNLVKSEWGYHWEPQWLNVCDKKGNIIVDFIGRFENFSEDLKTVHDKANIPFKKPPHINKTKHLHYSRYFNRERRAIVRNYYRRDFRLFGYNEREI